MAGTRGRPAIALGHWREDASVGLSEAAVATVFGYPLVMRGMRGRRFTALAVVGLVSTARDARAVDPGWSPPPIEEHRLDNGLRVVLAPDRALRDVTVAVAYDAGSGEDPDGKEGLAHLTEHAMFSAFRHGLHAKLLTEAGASQLNAKTGQDVTTFCETVPPGALELALWLEAARMQSDGAVDDALVNRERSAVGQEARQRGLATFFELASNEVFPEWHPYHRARDVLGSLGSIDAADVRAFAHTYYGPNDATLVVAGDFDARQVTQWATRDFGAIAPRPAPAQPPLPPRGPTKDLWIDVEATVVHPLAFVAWPAPPADDPESRAFELARRMLDERHGPLAKRFVDDGGPALALSARGQDTERGGLFAIEIAPRAGGSLERLLPEVQREVEAYPSQVTEGDVERAKREWRDTLALRLETSSGRASRLLETRRQPRWGWDSFDDVNAGVVAAALRRWLTREQRVTVTVRPSAQTLYGASAVVMHRDRLLP